MIDIQLVLKLHLKWLNGKRGGQRANLYGADLQGADLRGADLRRADLRGADLLGADLRGANLRGADLRRAELRGAELREADLRGANLRVANLRGANLGEADLRGAELDFSCFPLWCGSFNIITGDKLPMQLLSHIVRLNKKGMSPEMKKFINKIPKKFRNEMIIRHDLAEV